MVLGLFPGDSYLSEGIKSSEMRIAISYIKSVKNSIFYFLIFVAGELEEALKVSCKNIVTVV